MESIKYGVQAAPKGDFDRRGVTRNASDAKVYAHGQRDAGNKNPTYRTGDRSKNPKGTANSVKQVKSVGKTGSGQGKGANGFGKAAGSRSR